MDIKVAVNELIRLAEKAHGKLNKHVIAARDAMKDSEPVEEVTGISTAMLSPQDSAVESAPETPAMDPVPETQAAE